MTDANKRHRFFIGYSMTNRVFGFLLAPAVGLQLARTTPSTSTVAPGKLTRKEKVEPIERQGDRQVPQRSDLCAALGVCLGVPLGEKITSSTTPAK